MSSPKASSRALRRWAQGWLLQPVTHRLAVASGLSLLLTALVRWALQA